MLAALGAGYRLASDPSTRNYAVAGFLIGIATATKYNGVAVGIALLVAHFFATKGMGLRKMILSRQLGVGLGMALLGFLFGCPTALYEPKNSGTISGPRCHRHRSTQQVLTCGFQVPIGEVPRRRSLS
jgi:hypothetical protein